MVERMNLIRNEISERHKSEMMERFERGEIWAATYADYDRGQGSFEGDARINKAKMIQCRESK
jgi:hypothetical protein